MISINGIMVRSAADAARIIEKQMPGQGLGLVWRVNDQHMSAEVLL
jgi:hypothetical protein